MSGIIRWALGELGRQGVAANGRRGRLPRGWRRAGRLGGGGDLDPRIRAPPVENHGNEGDEHDQLDTQHGEQRDKHAGMPAHGRGRGTTRQG
jgi:hypothetical protein